MVSDKVEIQRLVALCHHLELDQVIISPGSRSAPLVISFSGHGGFTCRTITDERVAGFVGLGLGLELQKPAILICTSGTAVLNYAPAIAEAYYQRIPLLILTADRPIDQIDQGAGQTIRQREVYANYIKASYELKENVHTSDERIREDQKIIEAITTTMSIDPGPVHINIPLREPLYHQVPFEEITDFPIVESQNNPQEIFDIDSLKELWLSNKKRLVIIGQIHDPVDAQEIYQCLNNRNDVVVLSESVSNLPGRLSIRNIDRVIDSIPNDVLSDFYPDIIISFGGAVVSKKIKKLLIESGAKYHWHVEKTVLFRDTYKCLTHRLHHTPTTIMNLLPEDREDTLVNSYVNSWGYANEVSQFNHTKFLQKSKWSDLSVFYFLMQNIAKDSVLHLANSTPIRYVQLFDYPVNITYRCNRGVGGIDGCTSTAIGSALADDRQHILITGDLAFIYDSNAFWHNHIPSNLKIIVINNGGGGIFRIIPGPSQTDYLEEAFEAHHQVEIKSLAAAFNVSYWAVKNESDLSSQLSEFLTVDSFGLMEVFTPRLGNDIILKEYFNYIKENAFAHA